MTKLLLTVAILFVGMASSLAQSTENITVFKIKSLGNQYTESALKEAMLNADWCGMINPDNGYTLIFEDGAKVELLSAKDLIDQQINIDGSCVRGLDTDENATYKIASNGYIIRLVSKNNSLKTKITN